MGALHNMVISQLSNAETRSDFTHIAVFDHNDIIEHDGAANQVTIAQIPTRGAVEVAALVVTETFATSTNIKVDCGTTTADPDEFINNYELIGGTRSYNLGDNYDLGTAYFGSGQSQPRDYDAATDVVVEFNITGSAPTAGKVVIALRILDPGRFGELV